MELLSTPEQLMAYCRNATRPLGIVPTMGSIHLGHAELVKQAQRECKTVIVTLFINPLQFGEEKDFDSYPRSINEDSEILSSYGVDALYLPETSLIYPEEFSTTINVYGPALPMEGLNRPGHFDGVATIVAKLLINSSPDNAYFGRKDGQQLAVIKRMVKDLEIPTNIREIDTVREADGLAYSSRNNLLNSEQRLVAPILYESLSAGRRAFEGGERNPLVITGVTFEILEAAKRKGLLSTIDYVEMVDLMSMMPWSSGDAMLAGAIRLGDIRIIDNVILVENNIDGSSSEE